MPQHAARPKSQWDLHIVHVAKFAYNFRNDLWVTNSLNKLFLQLKFPVTGIYITNKAAATTKSHIVLLSLAIFLYVLSLSWKFILSTKSKRIEHVQFYENLFDTVNVERMFREIENVQFVSTLSKESFYL